jgi:hypothetical protein
MNEHDQSMKAVIADFKSGGWVVIILGAIGAFVGLVMKNEKYHVFVWGRKVFAGACVGVITYFALYYIDILPIYKGILYSISGAIAPELFDFISSRAKNMFSKSE